MNTKQLNRVFAKAMYGMVIAAIVFSATGVAYAEDEPPPSPFIAVSITQHWFWVNNFTPETLVTFYVYDHQGDENPIFEFNRNTDEFGNVTIEGWEHFWNPEPGDYIVATDGYIKKDLVLEYITLDVFDYENDFLSGEAAYAGRSVDIGVGNENGEQWMNVTAGENSRWEADFKLPGYVFDITENSWAGAHVNDEDGDVTAAHNSGPPPGPHFTVFPEWEWFDGLDWPDGANVLITVENKPECETMKESWDYFFNGSFGEGCDLEIGDTVTFTYGQTIRTHTVQNLTVTKANQEDDTIKGMADPGTEVYVWPHATGEQQLAIAKTKGAAKGKWNVDFTGNFDLTSGECGRSEIRDVFSNSTAVDWCIANPTFVAYLPWAIEGYDWPMDDTIKIYINGEYIARADSEQRPDFPEGTTRVLFDVGQYGITLQTNDHIVMTDESIDVSKEVWVTNLAVTDIDLDAKKVFGTYTYYPESESQDYLWVWLYDGDGQVPTMDPDGTWVATFDELPPGAWGGATQWDADGDGTSIDFPTSGE